MLSGRLYHAQDSELAAARLRARRLVFRYNQSAPENESLRRELARSFRPNGEGCYLNLRCVVITAPIYGWGTACMSISTSWCWTELPLPSAMTC